MMLLMKLVIFLMIIQKKKSGFCEHEIKDTSNEVVDSTIDRDE